MWCDPSIITNWIYEHNQIPHKMAPLASPSPLLCLRSAHPLTDCHLSPSMPQTQRLFRFTAVKELMQSLHWAWILSLYMWRNVKVCQERIKACVLKDMQCYVNGFYEFSSQQKKLYILSVADLKNLYIDLQYVAFFCPLLWLEKLDKSKWHLTLLYIFFIFYD